jgi:hypothetical protein
LYNRDVGDLYAIYYAVLSIVEMDSVIVVNVEEMAGFWAVNRDRRRE